MAKVLIDTVALRFAATGPLKLIPVNRPTIDAQGNITGFQRYEFGYQPSSDRIKHEEQKTESALLKNVAALTIENKIQLFTHMEITWEAAGLTDTQNALGPFFGLHMEYAKSPDKEIRILASPWKNMDQHKQDYLAGIKDERYLKLQKGTGGFQGEGKYNFNQMLDAYYIWIAEYNNLDFFLTLDFKLVDMLRHPSNKNLGLKVQVVKPSELLNQLKHRFD